MKKSINTFLKHPIKDKTNRSANPPVTRASTILFETMQEMYRHEAKIKQHKKMIKYEIKGLFFVGLSSLNGKKNILYQLFIVKF